MLGVLYQADEDWKNTMNDLEYFYPNPFVQGSEPTFAAV